MHLNRSWIFLMTFFLFAQSQSLFPIGGIVEASTATPQLQMELKTDYVATQSNDDTISGISGTPAKNSNKELDSKQFRLSTARIGFQGDIQTLFSYFFKWNVGASENSGFQKEGRQFNSIDELSLIYRASNIWAIQAGKFFTGVGGIEGTDYFDQLHHSYFVSPTAKQYGEMTHKAGAMVHFNWKSQKIMAMVFSARELERDEIGNPTGKVIKNQRTPGFGLVWHGRFLNDQIQPIASYHYLPTPSQGDSPSGIANRPALSDHYLALGSRVILFDKLWTIDIDYLWNQNRRVNYGTADIDSSVESFVWGNRFQLSSQFVSLAKLIYSNQREDKLKVSSQWDVGAGLEYYPYQDHDFRFHIFHHRNQIRYKRDSLPYTLGKKVNSSETILGMALGI